MGSVEHWHGFMIKHAAAGGRTGTLNTPRYCFSTFTRRVFSELFAPGREQYSLRTLFLRG